LENLTLKKLFSIPFDGLVWKVISLENSDTMLIEVRKQAQQTVHFFEFNSKNLTLQALENIDHQWWFGLQDGFLGIIIFQEYNHQQMPASKAIFAYQLSTKKVIWRHENLSYHHSLDKSIVALKQQHEMAELIQLDIETGKVIEGNIAAPNSAPSKNIYPIHYKNDNQYFVDIADFILKNYNHIAVHAIDYLEVGQLILISYYICDSENKLSNYLFIINAEGKLVLSDTLGEKLPGIGLDTFWIHEQQLLFIKNKSELNSYSLPLL
jgi:hypothetical protein